MTLDLPIDLKALSVEDKLALRDALSAHNRVTELNGLAMYRPHAKQDKFHRAGWAKYRYARTGNRFGKSDMGVAENVAFSVGERSWYKLAFPVHDGEGNVVRWHEGGEDNELVSLGIPQSPTKGLIICTDWEKTTAVFTREVNGPRAGKLWKLIPKAAFVRRETDHSGHINRFVIKSKWGGESVICIETVAGWKLNEMRGESEDYDWIHIDEPIPKEMFESYARGLIDRNGPCWFTCTPKREPWINELFRVSKRTVLKLDDLNIMDQDSVVIVGKSTDNPHISHLGAEKFAAKLDDRNKALRILGIPPEQSDIIHPISDDHLYGLDEKPPQGWSEMNKPPLDYTIRYHIDYHTSTPLAVLFAATAPDGTVWFFDEIFENMSPDIAAEMILNKVKNYFVAQAWMDPSGFVENKVYKTVFADDLAEYGIHCERASKDLNRGIIMTNQMLRLPGRLNFAYNLRETLYEFDNYMFQPPEKKPDKPVDKNDHMMEGLHRLIVGGLHYIDAPALYDTEVRESSNYLLSL